MGKKRIIAKQEEIIEKTPAVSPITPKGREMKEGRVNIYSSYNNTLMALSDLSGNVLFATSAGAAGFKGTKKSTPYAASKVAEILCEVARARGIERFSVALKGIGPGRESALRSLGTKGFEIMSIRDATPVPHNGPKPRKVRRV